MAGCGEEQKSEKALSETSELVIGLNKNKWEKIRSTSQGSLNVKYLHVEKMNCAFPCEIHNGILLKRVFIKIIYLKCKLYVIFSIT